MKSEESTQGRGKTKKEALKSLFFGLLREALWHSSEENFEELSAGEARVILRVSEEQAVFALMMDVFMRKNVRLSKKRLYKCFGMLDQIQLSNRQQNDTLKAFDALMQASGVDYRVVKGMTVAAHYPDPALRQSGDIDFYCDSTNFPKALAALSEKWGVEIGPTGSDHHVSFEHNEVMLEGHFALVSFYTKRKNEAWEKLLRQDKKTYVAVAGTEIPTLSPTLHTLYVFLHLYHHLLELGIGLRQFCDWAVMLHDCKENIDQEQLRQHLGMLGMLKAYRACGSILTEYLGLPEEELGCRISSSDKWYGRMILDVVLYRGNMGHYNKLSGFSGWRHNIEATGIKVVHFLKFMPLAPSYSFRWLGHELWRKVMMKANKI